MIWIIICIIIIIVVGKAVAKWATKDIADTDTNQKEFNKDNVYFDNYTQVKK